MKILENDKNLSDNEDSQDSNEEDTEKEEVPLTKKKSVRTEKQMEAFKKAQQTRQANIKKIQQDKELLKLNKKGEKILNKKKELIKDIKRASPVAGSSTSPATKIIYRQLLSF